MCMHFPYIRLKVEQNGITAYLRLFLAPSVVGMKKVNSTLIELPGMVYRLLLRLSLYFQNRLITYLIQRILLPQMQLLKQEQELPLLTKQAESIQLQIFQLLFTTFLSSPLVELSFFFLSSPLVELSFFFLSSPLVELLFPFFERSILE